MKCDVKRKTKQLWITLSGEMRVWDLLWAWTIIYRQWSNNFFSLTLGSLFVKPWGGGGGGGPGGGEYAAHIYQLRTICQRHDSLCRPYLLWTLCQRHDTATHIYWERCVNVTHIYWERCVNVMALPPISTENVVPTSWHCHPYLLRTVCQRHDTDVHIYWERYANVMTLTYISTENVVPTPWHWRSYLLRTLCQRHDTDVHIYWERCANAMTLSPMSTENAMPTSWYCRPYLSENVVRRSWQCRPYILRTLSDLWTNLLAGWKLLQIMWTLYERSARWVNSLDSEWYQMYTRHPRQCLNLVMGHSYIVQSLWRIHILD